MLEYEDADRRFAGKRFRLDVEDEPRIRCRCPVEVDRGVLQSRGCAKGVIALPVVEGHEHLWGADLYARDRPNGLTVHRHLPACDVVNVIKEILELRRDDAPNLSPIHVN